MASFPSSHPANQQQGAGPPKPSAPNYFSDMKKGEVNELQNLLRNPSVSQNPERMREVIKKVIAYMTLGIDVSRLFTEMVLACATRDLVQKKLVYLYLCNYAESNADLAILAINTLQKDCRDQNPMVRGLALRSMCSLRLRAATEYLVAPVQDGLVDPSAYVRKTAAMGAVKLHTLAPAIVEEGPIIDTLYQLIRDRDCLVITNAIHALNEILRPEGGMAVNKAIVMHLLGKMKEFDEFSLVTVMGVLKKYTPESEDEIFDIMNILDDRLKHQNSAVIMSIVMVFLAFTESLPDIQEEVFQRLKVPLLTLMSSNTPEISFPVLSHIRLLATRAPSSFSGDFKHFFVRYSDTSYSKLLKLDILALVSTIENYDEILSELSEYVGDVDTDIAKKSITCIGEIVARVSESTPKAVESLLSFLETDRDYIISESLAILRDVLRHHPETAPHILPAAKNAMAGVTEEAGRAALIWMLGEYGGEVWEAPYILEPIIDSYESEQSPAVRMELITASMKLFFRRPPEMQSMLGRLLSDAINDPSHACVHDRALFCYRLLSLDVSEAERIFTQSKPPVPMFVEHGTDAVDEALFKELNTLAVVYRAPGSTFTSTTTTIRAPVDADIIQNEPEQEIEPETTTQPTAPTTSTNLLDLDDFLSGTPAQTGPPPPSLRSACVLEPKAFQTKWKSLPQSLVRSFSLSFTLTAADLETRMKAKNLMCMASGGKGGALKAYFFGQNSENEDFVLLEMQGKTGSDEIKAVVKAETPDLAKLVEDIMIEL